MQTRQTAARSLKEKQRQEREELILQVAEEVLMEKGYYDSSIDEIAGRVGVAKGTVYLHFPSKEDLVIAIFARDMQTFLQGIQSVISLKQTAQEKLTAMLEYLYSGLFSKRTQLLYTIFNSAELRHTFMEKKGCLRELWEQISSLALALLEEGKASDEFDPEIPTSVMLSTFFSLLSPHSYERLVVGEKMSGEEMVHYLTRIYFGGVIKR
jgi:AcrR family transcriptional regulator